MYNLYFIRSDMTFIYAKGDSSIFWILTQKNRVKNTAFRWTVLKTFVCCCRGQFIQIKTHNLYFLEYKINTVVHMVYYVGDTIIFIPIRNIFGHFTLDFALILPFKIEINIPASNMPRIKKNTNFHDFKN